MFPFFSCRPSPGSKMWRLLSSVWLVHDLVHVLSPLGNYDPTLVPSSFLSWLWVGSAAPPPRAATGALSSWLAPYCHHCGQGSYLCTRAPCPQKELPVRRRTCRLASGCRASRLMVPSWFLLRSSSASEESPARAWSSSSSMLFSCRCSSCSR